jgi:hypothetical protein
LPSIILLAAFALSLASCSQEVEYSDQLKPLLQDLRKRYFAKGFAE